ncbi:hypothetical protein FRB99_003426, partial [Tulasnella sp. 403]
MKLPSKEMLEKAASLLLESFREENCTLIDGRESLVPTDTSIEGFDRFIAGMQAIADAFSAEIRRRSAKHKRSRNNTCVRINSLPGEVFVNILSLSLDFVSERLSQDLRQLASVCRFWFDTVVSFPVLWSHISNCHSGNTLEMFLRKSRCAPLHIHYEEWYSNTGTFWDLIEPHIDRLASLEHRTPGGTPGELPARDSSITPASPALVEVVSFQVGQARRVSVPMGTPLRRISLSGSRICWNTCNLSRLRSLQLYRLNADSGTPSFITLINIIASSPELEILILHQLGDSGTNHEAPLTEMLHLPAPKLFAFAAIPQRISSYLLFHLNPSRLCYLHAPVVLPKLVEASEPLFRSAAASMLRLRERIKITVWNGRDEAWITVENFPEDLWSDHVYQEHWAYSTPENSGVCLNFGPINPTEFLEVLENVTVLISTATTTIPISLYFDEMGVSDSAPPRSFIMPTSVLYNLPSLVRLEFKAKGIDVPPTLRSLAHPQKGEDGQPHWLCPHLSGLYVCYWEMNVAETMNFVTSRWDTSSGDAAGSAQVQDTMVQPKKLTDCRFTRAFNAKAAPIAEALKP